jgi:hypothetical protein
MATIGTETGILVAMATTGIGIGTLVAMAKEDLERTTDGGTTVRIDSRTRIEKEEGISVERGAMATGVDRDPMIEVGKTLIVKTDEDRMTETGKELIQGEITEGPEARRTASEEAKRKEEKISTGQTNQEMTKAMETLTANMKNCVRSLRNSIRRGRSKRRKTRTRPCFGPNRSWRT